jgi:cell division protein FtsZ
MTGGGVSVISVGESKGNKRVGDAVHSALNNALLDIDYSGAQGVLIHVTGGPDMTLGEVNEIGMGLTDAVAPDATVIWGARVLPEYENKIEVITIFTGVLSPHIKSNNVNFKSGAQRTSDEIGIRNLF